jgi:tetratricopeptide (TPR) repeat protein
MEAPKKLMCLVLLLATLSCYAKDDQPDQQSIDSLMRVIDKMAVRNYVQALHFIDSTLISTQNNPTFATQYLYVKMKKSNVLLKAKAYSKAFQNLLEVESVVNNHPDKLVRAFYQAMMAFIYGDQGDMTKAIACYNNSLAFYEHSQQYRKMAITRNNLADSYLVLGNYEQALVEINKALALHAEYQFDNIGVIYSTAGEIEIKLKNYEKALTYFNEAITQSKVAASNQGVINPEWNLFIAAVWIKKNEFTKAKSYIDVGKNRISNDKGFAFKYYLTLVSYFKAIQQFDSALVYNEKALALSRDIDKQQSAEAIEIVKLNEGYETENELLRQQIERKEFEQKLYGIIAVLAVLSVAFLVYAIVVKKRDYELLQIQNDEIAAQSEELRSLTDELAAQGEALQQSNIILEAKVNERTASLLAKNAQLTDYAFFNAHKLRSPIATLLGLKQLLQFSKSDEEREQIVEKIFITTEKFDQMVRESQKILENFDDEKTV